MSEMQIVLAGEERELLVGLLETALKDAGVEEHRTRAPGYREHIILREELMTRILSKLKQPTK